jgi:diadenosine tetraphosphate (Ap4A) HIT family hydrolase
MGVDTPRPTVDVENAGGLPREGYTEVLEQIRDGGFCPFCEENLAKNHPKPVLFSNGGWLVTENNWPYPGSTHHLIIIARRHIEEMLDIDAAEWRGFRAALQWISEHYELSGFTFWMRSGDTRLTGATVNHLHAQVVVGSPKIGPESEPILAVVGFKPLESED